MENFSAPTPVVDPDSTRKVGFSRRSLVRSAAWAVPVVAVAIAAPAASASTPPPPVVYSVLTLSKSTYTSADSGRFVQWSVTTTWAAAVTLVAVNSVLSFPKARFTGDYTFAADSSGWTGGTAVSSSSGTDWEITFTWTGVASPSTPTGVLKITPVLVATPTGTLNFSVPSSIGIDSTGAVTHPLVYEAP
ncbi:MAG: hypothetical protein JWQ64_3703 [Subtercola sp.]|nr:hypothetical protein [Subtercola sp.]